MSKGDVAMTNDRGRLEEAVKELEQEKSMLEQSIKLQANSRHPEIILGNEVMKKRLSWVAVAVSVLQSHLSASVGLPERMEAKPGCQSLNSQIDNEKYRNGFNSCLDQVTPIYAKALAEIAENDKWILELEEVNLKLAYDIEEFKNKLCQLKKQVFEWEKKNGIVSICSKHQIPYANCDLCNAKINALKKHVEVEVDEIATEIYNHFPCNFDGSNAEIRDEVATMLAQVIADLINGKESK